MKSGSCSQIKRAQKSKALFTVIQSQLFYKLSAFTNLFRWFYTLRGLPTGELRCRSTKALVVKDNMWWDYKNKISICFLYSFLVLQTRIRTWIRVEIKVEDFEKKFIRERFINVKACNELQLDSCNSNSCNSRDHLNRTNFSVPSEFTNKPLQENSFNLNSHNLKNHLNRTNFWVPWTYFSLCNSNFGFGV